MTFKVGDAVTVRDHHDVPLKRTTVRKVGVRKMVLADGSEWCSDGRPWGDLSYLSQRVTPERPDDADTLLHRTIASHLSRVCYRDLPLTTLRALIALLPGGSNEA